MNNDEELRQMFDLPVMPKKIGDNIGLKVFEDYLDVELPQRPKLKREKLGKHTPYKARGISFTSEYNLNSQRWRCLTCGFISSPAGIGKHQNNRPDHEGREQVFAELEKLGIV